MYKVKIFKDINLVLGILNGQFSKDQLNNFGNETVRNIEKNLTKGFTYILDVTNFDNNWHKGDFDINEKMDEINNFLDLMGVENTYIIGAGREVYNAYKELGKLEKTIFFTNLDEAFEFVKINKKSK